MKDQLKLLLVAGMFVFSGFACTVHACDSSDSEAEAIEKCNDDWWIDEHAGIGFRGDLNVEKSLVWTEEEKEHSVDKMYEYARKEVNSVKDSLHHCIYVLGSNIMSARPYWGFALPPDCCNKLRKNAGDYETVFTDKFRKNSFMQFIVNEGYFRLIRGKSNKYYLFPDVVPSKMALRKLFEQFKESK